MIHWSWLIAAFYAGLAAGIFVIALCRGVKDADVRPIPIDQKEDKP